MNIVKYELKYCERCGTLKLRPVSSTAAYCTLCERLLARYVLGTRANGAIAARLSNPMGLARFGGLPLSIAVAATAGRTQ